MLYESMETLYTFPRYLKPSQKSHSFWCDHGFWDQILHHWGTTSLLRLGLPTGFRLQLTINSARGITRSATNEISGLQKIKLLSFRNRLSKMRYNSINSDLFLSVLRHWKGNKYYLCNRNVERCDNGWDCERTIFDRNHFCHTSGVRNTIYATGMWNGNDNEWDCGRTIFDRNHFCHTSGVSNTIYVTGRWNGNDNEWKTLRWWHTLFREASKVLGPYEIRTPRLTIQTPKGVYEIYFVNVFKENGLKFQKYLRSR